MDEKERKAWLFAKKLAFFCSDLGGEPKFVDEPWMRVSSKKRGKSQYYRVECVFPRPTFFSVELLDRNTIELTGESLSDFEYHSIYFDRKKDCRPTASSTPSGIRPRDYPWPLEPWKVR